MSLQLIDLGRDVEFIPVDVDTMPCTFAVELDDKTFVFTFAYNEVGDFFTCDLETPEGDVLARGDVIRYGRPLFGPIEDERFPLPVIIPQCLSGEDVSVVTYENFGNLVKLYLHPRQVATP